MTECPICHTGARLFDEARRFLCCGCLIEGYRGVRPTGDPIWVVVNWSLPLDRYVFPRQRAEVG